MILIKRVKGDLIKKAVLVKTESVQIINLLTKLTGKITGFVVNLSSGAYNLSFSLICFD